MSKTISNLWKCFSKISDEKIQCCVCGVCLPRIFKNEIENTAILEEHLSKIHSIKYTEKISPTEKPKFNCTKCAYWAPMESNLKLHMKSAHPLPSKSRKLRSFVWDHFSKLSDDSVECNHCGQMCKRITGSTGIMRQHLKLMHSEKVPEIKEYLSKIHSIRNTKKIDFIEKQKFNCTKCNFWAPKQSNLKLHMKSAHPPKPRRLKSFVWNHFSKLSTDIVKCNFCGQICKRINGSTGIMRQHLKLMHSEKVPEIKEHLSKILHIRNTEEMNFIQKQKFNCTRCDFWAPKQSNLKLHMKSAHPIPRKPKILKSLVWNHFSKLSTDSVECNHCGKIYKRNNGSTQGLRLHLKLIHSEKVPDMNPLLTYESKHTYAKCQFCDKEFHYNAKRKKEVHEIRYHTKKYTLVCQHCGKGFASCEEHKIHESRHTGVKPFKCNFCAKSFTTSTELKQHLPVHTGKTPFQCLKCQKFFKFYSTRNNHKCLEK